MTYFLRKEKIDDEWFIEINFNMFMIFKNKGPSRDQMYEEMVKWVHEHLADFQIESHRFMSHFSITFQHESDFLAFALRWEI